MSPDDERGPGEGMDRGLARSRGGFMTRLRGLLGQSAASEADWEAAEEALIGGDLGPALVARVIATARSNREAPSAGEAVRHALANLLVPRPPDADQSNQETTSPRVILLVGVNGTGKTTTIGKLALREREAGRRVILGAADTFRAAAAEQLRVWAERAGADIVAHAAGADPGAVVFDSLDAAVARGADMVIIDTAGRLHTKVNLMDELTKIRRIIDRRLPGASVETLFVLDATTGQNGLAQAIAFHESVGLSGIVLTKLDSTSRGGIVFAIEDRLRVPVRYIGVGEGARDLIPFDPDAFVAALYGSPGA